MLLFGDGIGFVVAVGLWLFCVVDAITTPPQQVRNLPKLAWVFLVVLFLDLGALLWLLLGRPWRSLTGAAVRGSGPLRRVVTDSTDGTDGEGARRGLFAADAARPGARRPPANPDDDDEFLAELQRRAEAQRRAREDERRRDGGPGALD